MALASRCEVVLLSLLCPWLEGDVCCSWRAALLCPEEKKALRWLKIPVETILFHLVVVVVIVVALASHIDRQEIPSWGVEWKRHLKNIKIFSINKKVS